MDEILESKSIDYINDRAKDKKPFFLYIPWTAVHHPPIPHPDFNGISKNGDFADMIIEHDHRVGQTVKAVEDAGLSENTIIIYASDNGPDRAYFPDIGDSGPFRGYLGDVHEGSIRTPMIIKWKGKIEAGLSSNDIVSITDFLPTIADIVGGVLPTDRPIDRVNQKDLFFYNSTSAREGELLFHDETFIAAKWRQFKLYSVGEDPDHSVRSYQDLWAPQVYNIMIDPKEYDDIALQNLWVLGPALGQLVPFYASVKQYGLVQTGDKKPCPGEINIPFMKSSQLNKMFEKMVAQRKAKLKNNSEPDEENI
jgi:arylsulfatase A-like enzyme